MKRGLCFLLAVLLVVGVIVACCPGCDAKPGPDPAGTGEKEETGEDEDESGEGKGASGESDTWPGQEANGSGNIVNGGLVAHDKGYIYFSRRSDHGKLYRARPDGSERMKLSDDEARFINVAGDWIYYVAMGEPISFYDEMSEMETYMDNYGPIIRMKTDGSERAVVGGSSTDYLYVAGDWLYYREQDDGFAIYKIRPDGTGRVKITGEHVDSFALAGDWIYYVAAAGDRRIYKIRVDGGGRVLVFDGNGYFLNALNSELYFVGDILAAGTYLGGESLYRILTDGTSVKIGDAEPVCLNAAGERLYYTSVMEENLYAVGKDGSGKMCLSTDRCYAIFVLDDWLYYLNFDDEGKLYRVKNDGTGRRCVE